VDVASEPIGYMVVSDGGDRIHFLDWGGLRGPGIVLVHGLGASAWAWTAVARRLAAGDAPRRTIAMDLRGHGLSDAPTATGAYALDELASDVVAVRRLTPGDEDASGGPPPPGVEVVELEAPGHNLLRYRPDEVTAAILGR